MQPSVNKGGKVECVYLHRFEGEQRDPEILQLLDSLDNLLGGFPELSEEYSVWRAHNKARVAASRKPEEVPPKLEHFDRVARLEERTEEMNYRGESEDYATVAVTAAEAASIEVLVETREIKPPTSSAGASFLLKVCQSFAPEAGTEPGGVN